MRNICCLIVIVFIGFVGAPSVHAHFMFVRLLPPAEAGRFAEVYFSDKADAGDPRFIDKIASTKLWMQAKPGVFDPLTVRPTADRLRAFIPSAGGLCVVGECTYGVLARGKMPFLLRHYPKAVSGNAEEIAAFKPKQEIPFEIQMREVGGALEFVALVNGKPSPGASFSAVPTDLKEHKFTADVQGKATWKPTTPGYYAVYTGRKLKDAGTHDGEKYGEIREFTTLAFAWPLQAKGPDPDAVKLFQDATAARAAWHDFPGFRADISANADGRTWKGSVTIDAKGTVALTELDEVVTPWVREQLDSLVLHRMARPEGKPPIVRFADQNLTHALGRLVIFEGGQFASSYRVKDRQVMVVNRLLGKVNMTITVLENDVNADKKFLPRAYTVQYWNGKTGDVQRVETVQNRWTRLGAWDVPTEVTVLSASSVGVGVKTMTLTRHQLQK